MFTVEGLGMYKHVNNDINKSINEGIRAEDRDKN